jgi:hypothetical protein
MKARLGIITVVLIAALGVAPLLSVAAGVVSRAQSNAAPSAETHHISGIVHKIHGAEFSLENRNGQTMQVDASPAIQADQCAILYEGLAVSVDGTQDKQHVLHAQIVNRIKSSRAMWPADK